MFDGINLIASRECVDAYCYPGKCPLNSEGTKCVCPAGYTAEERSCRSICQDDPCGTRAIRGSCRSTLTNRHYYECRCQERYYFDTYSGLCEANQCFENPCENNPERGTTGTCTPSRHPRFSPFYYQCKCMLGYEWNTETAACEVTDMCLAQQPCGDHRCRKSTNARGYECICNTGHKLDSDNHQCVSYCFEAPCLQIKFGMKDTCKILSHLPYYSCGCAWGYQWDPATKDCVDINECESLTANNVVPCVGNGKCVNEEGGYRCMCEDGYIFDESATNVDKDNGCRNCCLDIDECAENPAICEYGHCVNLSPFYSCYCPFGKIWSAEQKNCIEHNECEDPEFVSCDITKAVCVDEVGLYRCECLSGYRLDIEAVQRTLEDGCLECCVDDDECFYDNPCDQICENKLPPENYKCSCKDTYKLAPDNTSCIHQCMYNTSLCSYDSQRLGDLSLAYINGGCVPEGDDGSYNCLCAAGYRYNVTTEMCTDINECEENGCDLEKSRCVNAIGTFQCICFDGYKNNPNDQSECVDIDECALSTHNCVDTCLYGTHSQGAFIGVNYTCGCNPGRYLDEDGYRCFKCQYEAYTEFSDCIGKCGVGERIRTRKVKFGHGEKDSRCNDKSFIEETIPCDTLIPCEVTACKYSEWNRWSDCTSECGGGVQQRTKFAIGDVNSCTQITITEEQICNSIACPAEVLNITSLSLSIGFIGLIATIIGVCIYSCRRSKSRANIPQYLKGI